MRIFQVGHTYDAILNGEDRTFMVLEEGTGEHAGEYGIRWDDGDEEWAYPLDMQRWTDEWKCKHVFKPLPSNFNAEALL